MWDYVRHPAIPGPDTRAVQHTGAAVSRHPRVAGLGFCLVLRCGRELGGSAWS